MGLMLNYPSLFSIPCKILKSHENLFPMGYNGELKETYPQQAYERIEKLNAGNR